MPSLLIACRVNLDKCKPYVHAKFHERSEMKERWEKLRTNDYCTAISETNPWVERFGHIDSW